MAYIKPKMNVFFANGGKAITAVIDKIAFRKYWAKPYKDSKTGKMVKKQKSMPFAVCRVILSFDPSVNVATLAVLQANGVEVVLPEAQGCCGAATHHHRAPCVRRHRTPST